MSKCLHQRMEAVTFLNFYDQEAWLDRCLDCGAILG